MLYKAKVDCLMFNGLHEVWRRSGTAPIVPEQSGNQRLGLPDSQKFRYAQA